jgi:chromosome segregation ATPase
MGFLDGIEKLINEHGSAVILKERIALASEQYAALERKLSEAERQIQDLEAEKQKLELATYKQKDQIRLLEEQLEAKKGGRLSEIEESLLSFLSNHEDQTVAVISRTLGINEQVVAFHLQEMKSAKMVSAHILINAPSEWYLAQEGRRYLISNGLLR